MKKRMFLVLSIVLSFLLNVSCLDLPLLGSGGAYADTFAPGSLIIPMDTTYQDTGMLKAYGLVYALLRQGIPVRWVIRQGKASQSVDFTASATDHRTGVAILNHGYRGGPFIIDSIDAAAALPVVHAWHAINPATAVHEVTTLFDADVARYLVAAPRIAVFANGNQAIERAYFMAAGIPDSTLDPVWPDTSPDMLTPTEIAGPTTTSHADGSLFDGDGVPLYCQFLSMHWPVASAQANPEVIAEVRQFLMNPVNFLAGCQAVAAFENDASYGRFLTPNGFVARPQPSFVDHHQADRTFAQFDGEFSAVGGSHPSFALPLGDRYKADGITMITGKSYAAGEWDVWMTGYLDGACPPGVEICGSYGKASYLGGHQYTVNLPVSANPATQGARLFLNSLFDSTCATASGQPNISVLLSAPSETADQYVQYTIDYANAGPSVAFNARITGALPSGAAFISATNSGVFSGGNIHWQVGNLGSGRSGTVSFIIRLNEHGTFAGSAQIAYMAGITPFTRDSNRTSTVYSADKPPFITAGATVTYSALGAPVVIDRTITVSDPDSTSMASATIVIGDGFTPGDTLVFMARDGIDGNYNSDTGILTLYGSSSTSNYERALRSVAYSSTRIDPSAEFAGRTIRFSVNDGWLDSNIATSTIIMYPQPGIAAEINFQPRTLNRKSLGKWIAVDIRLPSGYRASEIDFSSIRLEGTVCAEAKPPSSKKRGSGASHLSVKFRRSAVISVLPAGRSVPVHITGTVGTVAFTGVARVNVSH